jgi:glycine dehydrogenase subunit 1
MDFVPNTDQDREQMLQDIGVQSVDELLQVVPASVRWPELGIPAPLSEMELAAEMRAMAEQNVDARRLSYFLGAGSYHHYVPAAISQLLLRSEFYTSYTPYQPEISQGTLQSAFEFQSMISSLMELDVTNASMYDGATALAEAALMAISATRRERVVVSGSVHPEYREVLGTYLQSRGFEVVVSKVRIEGDRIVEDDLEELLDERTACCAVQQPSFFGGVRDLSSLADRAHAVGALFIISCYPISLGMLKSPGAWGADIAVGEGQPLGSGMMYGGPYLGLLACRERLVRVMPGRLVGAATDGSGRRGFVLTLQAREQHIRREKATSNICTSEQLIALAAAMYLSLMGPGGLRQVARLCYEKAHYAAKQVGAVPGFTVFENGPFFNEFVVECPRPPGEINRSLLERGIVGGLDLGPVVPGFDNCMLLCATENNSREHIESLALALRELGEKGGAR